ncbi:MAG: T9SS type A sorting domain-containing protein [Bacteroidota bacterium]
MMNSLHTKVSMCMFGLFFLQMSELLSQTVDNISDADGDTRVETEYSPDEDNIRFIIGGDEIMRLGKNVFDKGKLVLPALQRNLLIASDTTSWNHISGKKNVAIGNAATSSLMSSGSWNTFVGADVHVDPNSAYNTYIGWESGSHEGGAQNTFAGVFAGNSSSASRTVAIGYQAGRAMDGTLSVFLGERAGESSDTWNTVGLGLSAGAASDGKENIYVGKYAGANEIGERNIGLGTDAGRHSEGSDNVLIGTGSMKYANGSFNTLLGNYVLAGTGASYGDYRAADYTVSIGYETGFQSKGGDYNTFLGTWAGYSNTTADYNVFTGRSAGYNTSIGHRNSFIGSFAGSGNTTGSYNATLGYYSGYHFKSGSYNSALGTYAGVSSSSSNYYYSTALGYYARITASNQVMLGRTSTASIGGYQGWTNFSDGRFKLEVKETVPGLDFVMKLRPVTYKMDIKGLNQELYQIDEEDSESAKEMREEVEKMNNDPIANNTVHTGFIAQEVEAAAESLGFDFNGVDAPQNEEDHYGLRYATFVVPLVKAVQEQQTLIEHLQAEIKELRSLVQEADIERKGSTSKNQNSFDKEIIISPNPVNDQLNVRLNAVEAGPFSYTLSNLQGQTLLSQALHLTIGLNQLSIDMSSLASGTYLLQFPDSRFPSQRVIKQ